MNWLFSYYQFTKRRKNRRKQGIIAMGTIHDKNLKLQMATSLAVLSCSVPKKSPFVLGGIYAPINY